MTKKNPCQFPGRGLVSGYALEVAVTTKDAIVDIDITEVLLGASAELTSNPSPVPRERMHLAIGKTETRIDGELVPLTEA
jgi:hypothetical protein